MIKTQNIQKHHFAAHHHHNRWTITESRTVQLSHSGSLSINRLEALFSIHFLLSLFLLTNFIRDLSIFYKIYKTGWISSIRSCNCLNALLSSFSIHFLLIRVVYCMLFSIHFLLSLFLLTKLIWDLSIFYKIIKRVEYRV